MPQYCCFGAGYFLLNRRPLSNTVVSEHHGGFLHHVDGQSSSPARGHVGLLMRPVELFRPIRNSHQAPTFGTGAVGFRPSGASLVLHQGKQDAGCSRFVLVALTESPRASMDHGARRPRRQQFRRYRPRPHCVTPARAEPQTCPSGEIDIASVPMGAAARQVEPTGM